MLAVLDGYKMDLIFPTMRINMVQAAACYNLQVCRIFVQSWLLYMFHYLGDLENTISLGMHYIPWYPINYSMVEFDKSLKY